MCVEGMCVEGVCVKGMCVCVCVCMSKSIPNVSVCQYVSLVPRPPRPAFVACSTKSGEGLDGFIT